MADLIAPTKAGDVQAVRNIFDGQQHVELEAQDESGWTALMHAAKLGNGDMVQELLARGADPREAAAQELASEHAHVSAMIANAAGAQGFQYMPSGNFPGYANMSPAQSAGQYGYAPQGASEFYYPPPQAMISPMGIPEQSDPPSDGNNKPVEVGPANLPPPDVARNIPCRYFPNCKYGAKCIFAHSGPVNGLQPAASALPPAQPPVDARAQMSPMSPGMPPHSNGAPVYFQPPPAYGYGPMYGPPQPFYAPMAPPMPHMQYGMPMHYGPPPPMGPGSIASPDGQMSSPASAMPFSPQQSFDAHSPQQPNTAAPQFIPEHQRKQSGPIPQPGPLVNGLPNGDAPGHMHGIPGNALAHGMEYVGPVGDDIGSGMNGAGSSAVPPHRRQSFNSFLNRHTVQMPNQGPGMGGMPTFQPPRGGLAGKGRRGTGSYGGMGPLGFHKGESLPPQRPPCSFFARSECKNGDGCRFPHILDNGTDARNPEVVAAAQAAFNAARKAAIVHSTPEESVQVAAQAAAAAAAAASAQVAATAAATGVPPKTMAATQPRSAKPTRPVTAPVAPSQPAATTPTGPASAATTPPAEAPSLPVTAEREETTSAPVAAPSAPSQPTSTPTPNGPAAQNKAPNGIPVRPANGPNGSASLPGRPANGHHKENGQQGGNNNQTGKGASGKKKNNNQKQQQQQVTVPVPQQRLPKLDDFPALAPSSHTPATSALPSPGPASTSHGQSAAGSATDSVPSPELPAPTAAPAAAAPASAPPAPKANFSAVLSAPAPAKKVAAPATAANGNSAEDDSSATTTNKPVANGIPTAPAAEKAEKASTTSNGVEKSSEKAVPNGNHGPAQKGGRQQQQQPQANGHAAHKATTPQPPAPAAAPVVPEEDEDGFSMVKPRKRAAGQQTHQQHSAHAHQQISHSKAVAA
ncbi:hypothetical protein A4X13_0g2877 [Tilletia indica]|uniref:C3H1-type domain-containing protein n=1 Tax=Tilletia indica TaxID=43049 RepID=A0A177TTD9_9BASI|nr:hypothetical protein A4X13_0g2877 [Tilletia indica]